MGFCCCRCGAGIENGKDFIPIDPAGQQNRRWVCTDCATLIERQETRNILGKAGLEVTRIFSRDFLR